MDTWSAFAMGAAHRDKEMRVFDWDEAARRILAAGPDCVASAGLAQDWGWTAGEIYRDGAPVRDEYAYLASTWATPVLLINNEEEACYKMQSEVPDWGADTRWPASALAILGILVESEVAPPLLEQAPPLGIEHKPEEP